MSFEYIPVGGLCIGRICSCCSSIITETLGRGAPQGKAAALNHNTTNFVACDVLLGASADFFDCALSSILHAEKLFYFDHN